MPELLDSQTQQASKRACRPASKQSSKRASKQPSERANRRNYTAHTMHSMSNATSWYPYPTLTRREPCAAPVHCIERGSCIAAQWQYTERIVATYGTDWSSSRGPRNGRILAIWLVRLAALKKICNAPAQLPVWLISSSSKLKANAVLGLRFVQGR